MRVSIQACFDNCYPYTYIHTAPGFLRLFDKHLLEHRLQLLFLELTEQRVLEKFDSSVLR